MTMHARKTLSRLTAASLFVLTAAAASAAVAAEPIKLKRLNIDVSQTTTSGISSGAYMAGQFQFAYSGIVKGAAIVAGGPYSCATASEAVGMPSWELALQRCMATNLGLPEVDVLVKTAKKNEASKDIDPIANLAKSKIYLFNGANDKTVTRPVVDRTVEFYKAVGVPEANIDYVKSDQASHAFITDGYGAACDFTPAEDQKSEYINDCKYDQAGALLKHLYGELKTPNAATASGAPVAFDQTPYIGDASRSGMATKGFVYIPEACAAGQPCRLHVAFHGCKMAVDLIGDHFAVHAGYNRWADVNNIVVLYPQIDSRNKPTSNPKACWDWFAYTGYDFAMKGGFQMTAVRKMIAALAD